MEHREPFASGPVVIVTAVPGELAPLRRLAFARPVEATSLWVGSLAGQEVVLAGTGEGAPRARLGLEAVLAGRGARVVMGVGVAAGLTPDLRCGDVVVAREVREEHALLGALDGGWRARAVAVGARTAVFLSLDRTVTRRAERAALGRSLAAGGTGDGLAGGQQPAVVDRESSSWVRAARAHGIPCLLLRGVCDGAEDELPELLGECLAPDGGIDRRRFASRLARAPQAWPAALRMRVRRRLAARRAAELVLKILRAVPERADEPADLLFVDPASATSCHR